jgi:hypothetical protein
MLDTGIFCPGIVNINITPLFPNIKIIQKIIISSVINIFLLTITEFAKERGV